MFYGIIAMVIIEIGRSTSTNDGIFPPNCDGLHIGSIPMAVPNQNTHIMKPNKEVRSYAEKCIVLYGLPKFKRYLSEAIHDLSTEDDAIGNINQIYFFLRVLNYIKTTHMKTITWYEVFQFVDNNPINGTQTIGEFTTKDEAERFAEQNLGSYIDEWRGNADGSGIAKRIL